jgi:hypothetical protein
LELPLKILLPSTPNFGFLAPTEGINLVSPAFSAGLASLGMMAGTMLAKNA